MFPGSTRGTPPCRPSQKQASPGKADELNGAGTGIAASAFPRPRGFIKSAQHSTSSMIRGSPFVVYFDGFREIPVCRMGLLRHRQKRWMWQLCCAGLDWTGLSPTHSLWPWILDCPNKVA
ncbi:uncharacterized protein LY79DRAFT_577427 [Colletotrichum navitas]|uniref:Uncharacterized protein n=1 Tax=Colletotrichum navitas TaxID=681940 RepID=A0AAD8Q5V9_9PEZI|nr:uncharacterized protein LY79DRAFT_577427 [Colletotrichum navitas]KAK1596407.1 hypothetical protein LY79DRAFT_577427 [Colletotrichum navitas]